MGMTWNSEERVFCCSELNASRVHTLPPSTYQYLPLPPATYSVLCAHSVHTLCMLGRGEWGSEDDGGNKLRVPTAQGSNKGEVHAKEQKELGAADKPCRVSERMSGEPSMCPHM